MPPLEAHVCPFVVITCQLPAANRRKEEFEAFVLIVAVMACVNVEFGVGTELVWGVVAVVAAVAAALSANITMHHFVQFVDACSSSRC
jgi:hypothetical protein